MTGVQTCALPIWQALKDKDVYLDPDNLADPLRLTSLAYPSPNLIICGGTGTWILRSADKGETWIRSRIDSVQNDITRLRMINDKFGVAITLHELYTTTDGGDSWRKFENCFFKDKELLCGGASICNGADSIAIVLFGISYCDTTFYIKTRDRGNTWELIEIDGLDFNNLFFIDSLNGWSWNSHLTGKGDADKIMRTIDGAKTWTLLMDTIITPAKKLNDIYFLDKEYGMYWGNKGKILVTRDGGLTVQQEYLPDYPTGYDLSAGIILSEDNRLLFSTSGEIFRYENTVGTDEDFTDSEKQNFAFYNKTDNTINVPLSITGRGRPEFNLYDINGRLIYEFPEYLVLGSNGDLTLRLSGVSLNYGIYILSINNNEKMHVIKLIVSE